MAEPLKQTSIADAQRMKAREGLMLSAASLPERIYPFSTQNTIIIQNAITANYPALKNNPIKLGKMVAYLQDGMARAALTALHAGPEGLSVPEATTKFEGILNGMASNPKSGEAADVVQIAQEVVDPAMSDKGVQTQRKAEDRRQQELVAELAAKVSRKEWKPVNLYSAEGIAQIEKYGYDYLRVMAYLKKQHALASHNMADLIAAGIYTAGYAYGEQPSRGNMQNGVSTSVDLLGGERGGYAPREMMRMGGDSYDRKLDRVLHDMAREQDVRQETADRFGGEILPNGNVRTADGMEVDVRNGMSRPVKPNETYDNPGDREAARLTALQQANEVLRKQDQERRMAEQTVANNPGSFVDKNGDVVIPGVGIISVKGGVSRRTPMSVLSAEVQSRAAAQRIAIAQGGTLNFNGTITKGDGSVVVPNPATGEVEVLVSPALAALAEDDRRKKLAAKIVQEQLDKIAEIKGQPVTQTLPTANMSEAARDAVEKARLKAIEEAKARLQYNGKPIEPIKAPDGTVLADPAAVAAAIRAQHENDAKLLAEAAAIEERNKQLAAAGVVVETSPINPDVAAAQARTDNRTNENRAAGVVRYLGMPGAFISGLWNGNVTKAMDDNAKSAWVVGSTGYHAVVAAPEQAKPDLPKTEAELAALKAQVDKEQADKLAALSQPAVAAVVADPKVGQPTADAASVTDQGPAVLPKTASGLPDYKSLLKPKRSPNASYPDSVSAVTRNGVPIAQDVPKSEVANGNGQEPARAPVEQEKTGLRSEAAADEAARLKATEAAKVQVDKGPVVEDKKPVEPPKPKAATP